MLPLKGLAVSLYVSICVSSGVRSWQLPCSPTSENVKLKRLVRACSDIRQLEELGHWWPNSKKSNSWAFLAERQLCACINDSGHGHCKRLEGTLRSLLKVSAPPAPQRRNTQPSPFLPPVSPLDLSCKPHLVRWLKRQVISRFKTFCNLLLSWVFNFLKRNFPSLWLRSPPYFTSPQNELAFAAWAGIPQ